MRSFTASLTAALASKVTTLARAIEITPRNGTVFRFTDLAEAVTIHGSVYLPAKGMSLSSIPFTVNVASTRCDLEIVADSDGTALDLEEVRNGVFDYAAIRVYVFDWSNPELTDGDDANLIFSGNFGEIEWNDHNQAKIECTGILAQTTGFSTEVYTPACRTDFGDRRCRVPIMGEDPVPGREYLYGDFIRQRSKNDGDPTDYPPWLWMCTTPGVADGTIPTLSPTGPEGATVSWGECVFTARASEWTKAGTVGSVEDGELADRIYIHVQDEPRKSQLNWFKNGMLIFRTGALAGKAYEIRASNDNLIYLFLPLEIRPENGDWVEIFPGCDHSPSAAWGCNRYDNILNYRGEPWAPSDVVDLRDPDTILDE